ncbi:CBS domain-containing protein [Pseudothermotoga thermarum]|uniref:CBS domain containing protein n=1 Tax=Pseudothermotoga thermarum DSM 5069 TaxID=688269 RepID=F7YVA8_9THEM|nr:CBS domain-containing protein [Pseudothermotoga thermarum]AEH50411.1 CBS domain containing protein [Pseudothermotoga thermarum DSM 5069]
MKLIVGHKNPDFDCFASCVAAKKLFPDHTVVISGSPQQNVSQYLRIYEDRYPYITESDLGEEKVESLVIVDTASRERLGPKIQQLVDKAEKIVIYDHHPDIKEVTISGEKHIESIGATVTLLVEEIKNKGISIDSMDATLFAIAIYEDTGNLLYTSTTVRDLEALKFLFEKNANLAEVAEFVRYDLNYEQKLILDQLISNIEQHNVKHNVVHVATAETDKFIGGLSAVVTKLWELQGVETLICIIRTGRKIHIIGRTSSEDIDIGGFFTELGGGGHRKAGSCTVNLSDVLEAKRLVLEVIQKYVEKGPLARDVMSSPVRVAYSDMTIEEVNKIMERTGHNGLPVIEGNKLVGIVTKKAVDKAVNHGLLKNPVKSIMSTKLVVVDADTPLSKVRKIMADYDIGRIPVIENGVLVGIITRTDVMRMSFSDAVKAKPKRPITQQSEKIFHNVHDKMISCLPREIYNLLKTFGQFGDEVGLNVYVVGGFVRDLLMDNPSFDIDLVVERDGLKFAEHAAEKLKATLVKHDKFLTASLFFNGRRVDVATARIEYYEAPTELPQVEISTIRKDLYRRDFTINAMAIKLNHKDFGLLLDFFGGQEDIQNKKIRCLHTLSFIEDPTRILRAVRFEVRFDFTIEEETERLMREAIHQGYLEKVSGQRIRQEFEKIVQEIKAVKAIKRLAEFDAIKRTFPGTFYTATMEEKLRALFDFLPWAEKHFGQVDRFYSVMFVLLEYHNEQLLNEIKERYGLSLKFLQQLKLLKKMIIPLSQMIKLRMNFSDIYKVTHDISPEGFCYIASYLEPDDQEYLKQFLERVSTVKLTISGKDLIDKFGLKPSKKLGEILESIYCAKLDGLIDDSNELEYVKSLIESASSNSR